MKKVYIVVTPFFPTPESWRGAFCYDFVKALMRTEKYDVHVFVPGAGEDYDYQGVHVCRFKTKHLPSNIFPFLFKRWNQRSFLNKVKSIGVDVSDVAVCHGHTAGYVIYPLAVRCENPKCLTLLHHHDPQSYGLNNSRLGHCWCYNLLQFPLLRHLHEQMDGHVFISEIVKQSFLNAPNAKWTQYGKYLTQMRGLGFYRSSKIKTSIILHNGVDFSLFKKIEGKKLETRPFMIGCVGNFSDWKDQQTLIKAAHLLREKGFEDFRIIFIGSGECLEECRRLIQDFSLGNCIEIRTEGDHTTLPDFYRGLDLFVLPSYFEGFGCVFTEAWACGVPFITCEGQGMDDIIDERERSLWLCKQRNPQDLAEKILYYYQNRPQQHLTKPIDIDILVRNFVNEIEAMR